MDINNNNKKNEDLFITNKMNSYYKNLTYYSKYDFDIWSTVIIFLIVLYIVIYYFIKNNLQMIKNDWDKYKCNPFYMPFASVINSKNSEFTNDNYKQCLNQSNFKLGIKISKPFDIIFYIFKVIFSVISTIFLKIIRFIVYLLMQIVNIFRAIIKRILKIFDELNFIFIRLADMVNHVLSIFTYIYYICLKVIHLVRFAFVLIQIAFFGMVVMPVSLTTAILFLIAGIQLTIAWIFSIIPFAGLLALAFWGIWGLVILIAIACCYIMIFLFDIHGNMGKATTTNVTELGKDKNTDNTTRNTRRRRGSQEQTETGPSGFQNLNDIEYDYEDKETIIKEKLKYIVLDTRQKILAGNFKDININPDNLLFKDNKVLPKCCDYNPHYSSDKGCVCSTLEQEEYLKRNGLNKSYNNNEDFDNDYNEKNININNLFFSPSRAFKGEESVFNDVTNKDKNKYINKNDIFHSDLSKNIVYSKLYLQSR